MVVRSWGPGRRLTTKKQEGCLGGDGDVLDADGDDSDHEGNDGDITSFS